MKITKAILAAMVVLGLGTSLVNAQITFDMATVGDINNANDSTGYGAVAYEYRIQTTEVTLSQYTAFLTAVAATDTYNLYNAGMGTDLNIAGITRSGSSGSYTYAVVGSGDRPVTYVSWFDAARFANWVANGQPTGAQGNATTENGAYTLNGATSGVGFAKNAINPNTSATTTYWIPSEDEWYKSAYYDPTPGTGGGDNYWLYPTRSGSYYGTFDQGGNVWEWNDAVISGSSRGFRGGSWKFNDIDLLSFLRIDDDPEVERNDVGFRVASVPEPSTAMLVLLGGGAYLLMRRRKATL